MDEDSGWCIGCGRTALEIAEWPGASEARCAEIWHELPARIEELERRQGSH